MFRGKAEPPVSNHQIRVAIPTTSHPPPQSESFALKLYKQLCDQVVSLNRNESPNMQLSPFMELLGKLHNLFLCDVCGLLTLDPYRKLTDDCTHNVCRSCIGMEIASCVSCTPEEGCFSSNTENQLLLKCYTHMCKLIWSSSFFRQTFTNNYIIYKPLISMVAEAADFQERIQSSSTLQNGTTPHPRDLSQLDDLENLMDNLLTRARMSETVNYDAAVEHGSPISEPEAFVENPESTNLNLLLSTYKDFREKNQQLKSSIQCSGSNQLQNSSNRCQDNNQHQNSCNDEDHSASGSQIQIPSKRKQCFPNSMPTKLLILDRRNGNPIFAGNSLTQLSSIQNNPGEYTRQSPCSSPEIVFNAAEFMKQTHCICNSNTRVESPLTPCFDIRCPCYINDRPCSHNCRCLECDNPIKASDESNNLIAKPTVNRSAVPCSSTTLVEVNSCNQKNTDQVNRSPADRPATATNCSRPSFLRPSPRVMSPVLPRVNPNPISSGNQRNAVDSDAPARRRLFCSPSYRFDALEMDVGETSSTLNIKINEILRPRMRTSVHTTVESRTVVRNHSPQVNMSESGASRSKAGPSNEPRLSLNNSTTSNPSVPEATVVAGPSTSGCISYIEDFETCDSSSDSSYDSSCDSPSVLPLLKPPILNNTDSPDNPELFDFSLANIRRYLYAERGTLEKPGFIRIISTDSDEQPKVQPNAELMKRVEELNIKIHALALANPALLAYYIRLNRPKALDFMADGVITID